MVADLQLEHLTVVYPGKQSYELGPEVTVLPIDTAVAAGIDSLMPKGRPRARVKRDSALRHYRRLAACGRLIVAVGVKWATLRED